MGKNGKKNNARVSAGTIRVMVVDDSITARTVLCKIISEAPDLALSATANSAEQAIEKLSQIEVDVVLLDLEMPGIGGLAALPEIIVRAGDAKIMIVSSLTAKGAKVTIAALSMGAADTILKPRPGEFTSDYRIELANRIRALGIPSVSRDETKFRVNGDMPKAPETSKKPARVIAIGASTGGIHSMCQFLSHLPKDFEPAILVTQHLPQSFMSIFAGQIEIASSRKAAIAQDGMPLTSGEVLIAPGDGHLAVKMENGRPVAHIARHRVPNGCRPSVDPMLGSLAECLDGEMIGVILSGMGRDGLIGARQVVDAGGIILAQNPETCAVWGMPRAVAEAGLASAVAPPEELASLVLSKRLAPA